MSCNDNDMNDRRNSYFGPVHPRRRPEAHAIPQRVDEYEDYADRVRAAVRVVWVYLA